MTIGTNSYSSVAEVEAVTKVYTSSGTFSTTTTPTLAQVEKFIDRTSAMLNACLAKEGFTIPVTQADAKLALDEWVTRMAADLVHYSINGAPYSQAEQTRGGSPNLYEQACKFVEEMAAGFENLGADRSSDAITAGMGYLETTDDGSAIDAIFQRDQFDFKQHRVDWDAA